MVWFFLISMMCLFLFSYYIIDSDLLSPVLLFQLFSIFSILTMLIFYVKWELNDYGAGATSIYLGGSVFFIAGCSIAKFFSRNNIANRVTIYDGYKEVERIDIGFLKIAIANIVGLAGLYGTISFLKELAGSSNFIFAMARYRFLSGQGVLIGENAKGRIWSLCSSFSIAFAYCCIFIVINNIVNRKFKKKDLLLVTPFLLKVAEYTLLSSRGDIINMVVAAIMSWFIALKYKKGWRSKVNHKVIKTIFRVAIIFVPFFFWSLIFSGRYETLKGFDFINSSVIYISGGIRNLDLFVKNPTVTSEIFGEETFSYLIKNLNEGLNNGINITRILEYRKISGINTGNIYTAFRRFYHDFGVIGVCLLSMLQGWIISTLYYNINRVKRSDKIGLFEILYCFLSCTTIYMVIEDTFYSYYASITGFKIFVIFFIVYIFIFSFRSSRIGVLSVDLGKFKLHKN